MSPHLRRLQHWLRAHPTARDGCTALAILVTTLPHMFLQQSSQTARYTPPDALDVVLVTLAVAALTLRRRKPLLVLGVVMAAQLTLTLLGYEQPTVSALLAFLIAVYSVAAHRPLALSVVGGVAGLVLFLLWMASLPEPVTVLDYLTNAAVLIGVWSLGRGLRLRRAYLIELEERAARLEHVRSSDARAARVEERSRIARELHDVVAHHVSVMTVQAGAARRILDRDPERTREALTTIEEVGRTALSEMRRIVGVLRTEHDPGPTAGRRGLAPQPGVRDVASLVEHIRETGLVVQLSVEGTARTLSPGVDLAAYRLVQEALTNTLKHAGPHARAWVWLHYGERELTVDIEDDGRGAATAVELTSSTWVSAPDATLDAGSGASSGSEGGLAGGTADGPGLGLGSGLAGGRRWHSGGLHSSAGGGSGGSAAAVSGHGLVGMYERVALYGGDLRIGPRSGGGFEVRARFPLDTR